MKKIFLSIFLTNKLYINKYAGFIDYYNLYLVLIIDIHSFLWYYVVLR
jgi:hypothetical protein